MQLLQTVYTTTEPDTYVLHGCTTSDNAGMLALSLSNHAIRLYDTSTAAFVSEVRDHTETITDMLSSPSHSSLLFSSQEDGGVLVTDVRQAAPAHFLVDACHTGITCSTISIAPSGTSLVMAKTSDLDVYDTRTWSCVHRVEAMHWDEISRVRHLREHVICSAGEDLMVNMISVDPKTIEDDLLLEATQCGEVATKMAFLPNQDVVTIVGSCENGYVFPCDVEPSLPIKETGGMGQEDEGAKEEEAPLPGRGKGGETFKYDRPDFSTYLVDWCTVGNELTLVSGVRTGDGEAGALSMNVFGEASSSSCIRSHNEEEEEADGGARDGGRWYKKGTYPLMRVHRQLTRIALGLQRDRMITGGEDGIVAFWGLGESSAVGGSGWAGRGEEDGWCGSSGASNDRPTGFLSSRVHGGQREKGNVSVFHPSPTSDASSHSLPYRGDRQWLRGGYRGRGGRGGFSAPYKKNR